MAGGKYYSIKKYEQKKIWKENIKEKKIMVRGKYYDGEKLWQEVGIMGENKCGRKKIFRQKKILVARKYCDKKKLWRSKTLCHKKI
jgi:hypothetical protein